MGNWKAVKTNLRKDPKARWQLFDLSKDVNETTDISAQHPDLLQRFDAIVKKEHKESHIKEWQFVQAVIEEK
jgi:arylsulfatase A